MAGICPLPTCVGNTTSACARPGVSTVHPHVRGEYTWRVTDGGRRGGSSPRAWGIHKLGRAVLVKKRFIPTCVGNTLYYQDRQSRCSVHPHVRGEYGVWIFVFDFRCGSSPRAWGIRTAPPSTVSKPPVHPHVRGEYSTGKTLLETGGGSSPRAWGILWSSSPPWWLRFIPTCVGNTLSSETKALPPTVHPHVRGEYDGHKGGKQGLPGSSPRAWGIRAYWQAEVRIWRFIPRAWGIPRCGQCNLGCYRFIPTCVGNTSPAQRYGR